MPHCYRYRFSAQLENQAESFRGAHPKQSIQTAFGAPNTSSGLRELL
jgi:hypothetical protein